MNLIFDVLASVLRGVVKAVLIVLTAMFAFGLLCVGLVLALAHVIRYLLTGRKPAVFTIFTRFNQTTQHFRAGNWPGSTVASHQDNADIVDVQAHEVHAVLTAPTPPKTVD